MAKRRAVLYTTPQAIFPAWTTGYGHEKSEDRNEEVRKQGWTDRVAIKYDEVVRNDGYEWAGGASRYEWAGEEGDVGPRNEDLERQLFNNIHFSRVGHRIEESVPSIPRFLFSLTSLSNQIQKDHRHVRE